MFRVISHKGSITRLIKTVDSKLLFTAGEDGCIFVYQLKDEKVVKESELRSELASAFDKTNSGGQGQSAVIA